MGKKKNPTTPAASGAQPALKIGSRVRCLDGMLGRIAWANGVSVKIRWDNGEEITWRRDTLAWRPIDFLDAAADTAGAQQPEQPPVTTASAPAASAAASTEPDVVTAAAEPIVAAAEAPAPEQTAAAPPAADQAPEPVLPPEPTPAPATMPAELGNQKPEGSWEADLEAARPDPSDLASEQPEKPEPAKPKRERKAKTPTEPQEKKGSALDAAFRVLVEAGKALTCKEMIGAMAIKGYWSSPGGKTPDATLCSAILREIKMKGEQSRFIKAAPGRFSARPTA
jgi:hypothetical protein